MDISHLLYLVLSVFFLIIIFQQNELVKARKRISILEKRLSNNNTDFEKLSFIIEIYRSINFNNINQDEKQLWNTWINRLLKYKNMTQFVLNDKPAIKLNAIVLYNGKNNTSIKFDCGGDIVWFSKKCIKLNGDGTILVEEWLYNTKVEDGEL